MSKPEKYWVFGMIWMMTVKHYEDPSLWNSLINVMSFLLATVCFVLMVWHFLARSDEWWTGYS